MATFTCSALGGPGNIFVWIRLLDDEVAADGPILMIEIEDAFDGSEYECLVVNDAGNDTTVVTLNGMLLLHVHSYGLSQYLL